MNKKWILVGLLVVLAIMLVGVVATSQKSKLSYLRGWMHAKAHGQVSGATIVRLNVPFYKQEHSLSCEVASLRMALAGVGANVTESELISLLPFDNTPKQNGVWGDPYLGFVGNIDGRQPNSGYGVYWGPIADVGKHYRFTQVIENATAQDLTKHLLEGSPIVYWGSYGWGKPISWKTPGGKQINAMNGQHARTIIGFSGAPENPDGFLVMDPIYGEMFWTTQELLDNGRPFNSSGVVVHKSFSM